MKQSPKVIFLLFIILAITSCSIQRYGNHQSIESDSMAIVGTFVAIGDMRTYQIELKADSHFVYREWFDLYGAESHGRWFINNNKICFKVEPDTLHPFFRALCSYRYYSKMEDMHIINEDSLEWFVPCSTIKNTLMFNRTNK